ARFALNGIGAAPATFGYFHSPELARTVRRLLDTRGFHAIVVYCLCQGAYVAGHRGCRKVIDFGDADSEKCLESGRTAPFPLSQAFRLEGWKVRRSEAWLGKEFDACSVNAPRERDVLAAYVHSPIHVIPNGVDLEYFEPTPPSGRGYVPNRIAFTGNMSYRPNVDAVQRFVTAVLPRIRREIPDVQLCIVGMDPTPAVRRLADEDRVVVTGRVDDVRPYFDSAAVP